MKKIMKKILYPIYRFCNLKLNNLLNYDYGNPSSLIKIRSDKVKKRFASGSAGSIEYLVKGYAYIGNMEKTEQFSRIKNMYEKQIENQIPVSPYTEEVSIKLCLRDKLTEETRKLQLVSEIVDVCENQPSMVSRKEIIDLYPPSISKMVNDCLGFEVVPKSLIAWTQVSVPYKPWLHRDSDNPMRYKLFLLLEDVDQRKGPTIVYTRLQSFLIGMLFCTPVKLDFTKTSNFAPKFLKPFKMKGRKGDVFLVQTHENYHSEGVLEEGCSRSIAQYYLSPK